MEEEKPPEPNPKPDERPAGWLILRVRPGEGIVIGDQVEVRLATINSKTTGSASIALRAPRTLPIRRVR